MSKISAGFKIGCHVSAAGGVWNAPKNAQAFGCEVFQIFSRPPQGGPAPKLTDDVVEKFKAEMEKYKYDTFVVHCPYFVNFASDQPRIYHGSASVVREELERSSLLGAKYCMTHLGSARVLGKKAGLKQVLEMLKKVLDGYKGPSLFLLEISAGAGEIIGDSFEELAVLARPLLKYKGFGGICFDTQHAFASGYDLRTMTSVKSIFQKFDKTIDN
jgi:deoxyribonuclease-4